MLQKKHFFKDQKISAPKTEKQSARIHGSHRNENPRGQETTREVLNQLQSMIGSGSYYGAE